MNYYILEPEVAGELGENSEVTYENGKIKEVAFLEYTFTGWLGDELLTTHPCFIVTESLKKDIILNALKGVTFRGIEMSFSEEFYEAYEEDDVPRFLQIICETSYEDNTNSLELDFYYNRYKEMIVSEKALYVLKAHKLNMCVIKEI